MTKEVISLSRLVKERDEKLYAAENRFNSSIYFVLLKLIFLSLNM